MSMYSDMLAEAHYISQFDTGKVSNKVVSKDCGTCASCQWKFRWEAIYVKFLQDNPKEVAFIQRMKKTDKALVCQRAII